MKDGSEKRRTAREKVQGQASFRETGSGAFAVELSDIAPHGFCMLTYSRPAVGTHIWVKLPGLNMLEAVVRRCDGNEHGCEFVHPLHAAVADHLVREWG